MPRFFSPLASRLRYDARETDELRESFPSTRRESNAARSFSRVRRGASVPFCFMKKIQRARRAAPPNLFAPSSRPSSPRFPRERSVLRESRPVEPRSSFRRGCDCSRRCKRRRAARRSDTLPLSSAPLCIEAGETCDRSVCVRTFVRSRTFAARVQPALVARDMHRRMQRARHRRILATNRSPRTSRANVLR